MAKKKKKKSKTIKTIKTTKTSKAHQKIYHWPGERNILFRPERYKYVRNLVKEDGCVFCRSAELGVSPEGLCVYQSSHSMILLNKYPYNPGHLLVLPKNHGGQLLDLSPAQFQDLHSVLRTAVEAVQKIYTPAGINLGMNMGKVSGAGIPEHLHYHVIPRWAGDLNFFPLVAQTKVVVEDLDTTYSKLRAHFHELG